MEYLNFWDCVGELDLIVWEIEVFTFYKIQIHTLPNTPVVLNRDPAYGLYIHHDPQWILNHDIIQVQSI